MFCASADIVEAHTPRAQGQTKRSNSGGITAPLRTSTAAISWAFLSWLSKGLDAFVPRCAWNRKKSTGESWVKMGKDWGVCLTSSESGRIPQNDLKYCSPSCLCLCHWFFGIGHVNDLMTHVSSIPSSQQKAVAKFLLLQDQKGVR